MEALSYSTVREKEETAYLLRNPTNAQKLRESIKQAEKGQYKRRRLIEE